jgi:MYXO-CTERM domain-containing protein
MRPTTFWLAVTSLVPMTVGAFGPWVTVLGVETVSGTDDNAGWTVVGAAAVAALALAVYHRRQRRWICGAAVLAGAIGIAVTASNIHDFSTYDGLATAAWGIYVALAGSVALVLTALLLAAQTKPAHETRRVAISGSSGTAKIRSPWGVFLLACITFGIYYLYWYYQANRELRDFGFGTNPTVSLVAQFPGGLLIVPPFVSWWRFFGRLREAQARAGTFDRVDHATGIVLYVIAVFLLPFELVYAQQHLSSLWETAAGPAAGSEAITYPEPFAALPPQA